MAQQQSSAAPIIIAVVVIVAIFATISKLNPNSVLDEFGVYTGNVVTNAQALVAQHIHAKFNSLFYEQIHRMF